MNDVSLDEVIRQDPSPSGGPTPRRRGTGRDGRGHRIRSAIAVVVALALLVGAGYAAVRMVGPLLDGLRGGEQELTDYPGPGHSSVEVVIPQGATGAVMAQELHAEGVVATTGAFTQAFAANPDAQGIQPGTYRLMLQMRASDAVAALLDPGNRVETRVTIPEGFRVDQVVDRLASVTGVAAEEVRTAMEDTAATGLPPEAGGVYEGWLFPATYTFEPAATATDMVAAMVRQTVVVLEQRGVPPEQRQEVLIKASLVERESPNAQASPRMARAIENRLERGMPLQIDAAVAYGLDKPGTELTEADISSAATDNPYNTYAHTGLPPTPIASPGADSVDAVLAPEPGPWLFWVTVNLDTGETLFSETYEEHQRYVQQLREWQAQQE